MHDNKLKQALRKMQELQKKSSVFPSSKVFPRLLEAHGQMHNASQRLHHTSSSLSHLPSSLILVGKILYIMWWHLGSEGRSKPLARQLKRRRYVHHFIFNSTTSVYLFFRHQLQHIPPALKKIFCTTRLTLSSSPFTSEIQANLTATGSTPLDRLSYHHSQNLTLQHQHLSIPELAISKERQAFTLTFTLYRFQKPPPSLEGVCCFCAGSANRRSWNSRDQTGILGALHLRYILLSHTLASLRLLTSKISSRFLLVIKIGFPPTRILHRHFKIYES